MSARRTNFKSRRKFVIQFLKDNNEYKRFTTELAKLSDDQKAFLSKNDPYNLLYTLDFYMEKAGSTDRVFKGLHSMLMEEIESRKIDMFETFLNENNIKSEFYRQSNSGNKRQLIKNKITSNVIDRELYWARTSQGQDFWSDLNAKWRRIFIDEKL